MIQETFRESFENKCQNLYNTLIFNKYNFEREYVNRYKFKTKNSSDIKYDLLMEAEKLIDRKKGKEEIQKYVVLDHIADQIEKGLFEFSLIHVIIHKLQNHFVENIYFHRLNDLCVNLDIDNKNVENYTLLPSVIDGTLYSYFLAFFSYDVLHPKKWASLHLKKKIHDEAVNSLQTTDIYQCSRCKERKFKITEIQLRSIDESVSRICQCMVCYKTFII